MSAERTACDRAREKLSFVLEDPAAEAEVLAHAEECLACADAYQELRETADRLQNAGAALSGVRSRSTSILDAIAREERRRARRRGLAAAGALLLVLVVALVGRGRRAGDPAGPATAPGGATPVAAVPSLAATAPPSSGSDPGRAPDRPELRADPVGDLHREVEAAFGGSAPPGFVGTVVERGRQLRLRDLEQLIERVKGTRTNGSAQALRDDLVARLEALADKRRSSRGVRPSPTPR